MVLLPPILACLYGLCAFYVFRKDEQLPGKLFVQLVYFTGFIYLLGWALRSVAGITGAPGGLGSGIRLVIFVALTIIIVTACNMPPIMCIVSAYISKVATFATSDDNLVFRKQYCQAAGAEAHGDLDKAARLYREEIQKDPKDAEVHLLLAEVLLKQNLPNGAVDEFRTAIAMLTEERDRASAMFRLGEVLEENLNQPTAAREVYDRIIRDCPRTPFAAHARKRLEN